MSPKIEKEVRKIGFCTHCGNRAPQRLVYVQEFQGRWFMADTGEDSDGPDYGSTYFVAVCGTCNEILVYVDVLNDITQDEFTSAQLLWPKVDLHKSVPPIISDCYKEASRIRELAPNAFAVQIRRALEAVCDDRGAQKGSLQQRLKELVIRGELPPVLGEMTEVLRLVGNIGAHATDQNVKPGHVSGIDDFFRVVVEYVYVAPSKLEEFRNTLNRIVDNKKDPIDVH